MRVVIKIIQLFWWATMFYLPVAILNTTTRLYAEIGCPPQGDCYLPGSNAGFSLELLAFLVAAIVWPVSIWFLAISFWSLGGSWLAQRLGILRPPNPAFERDAAEARRPSTLR